MNINNIDITGLFGVPGAGKSTLTGGLPNAEEYCGIATGNILREAVANGTDLGKQAKPLMDAGLLVPDDIIIGIVDDKLQAEVAAGKTKFYFDGFPRTIAQAKAMLAKGIRPKRIIFVDLPLDTAKARASKRRVCSGCGRSYSLEGPLQPEVPGICDVCHAPLTTRKDDAPETVEKRQSVYMEQTRPVLDFLQSQGIPVFTVDNSGDSDTAIQAFAEALTK